MSQVLKEDVQDAITLIDIINKEINLDFKYVKTLDLERVGGNTKAQPEAIFFDSKTNTRAVVEVKYFAYEDSTISDSFIHKVGRLNSWLVEYFSKFETAFLRYVIEYKVLNSAFSPTLLFCFRASWTNI